jgi:hypothetical protein
MESEDSTDEQSCGGFSSRNSVSGSVHRTPHSSSKTGRKGDARMHRAVGARLANPKISLFNALKIGGFQYENDDDANAVDSEQITLTQRKNQLSRRIRFAQKLHGSNSSLNMCATSPSSNQSRQFPDNLTSIFNSSGKKRPLSTPNDENSLSNEAIAMTSNCANSSENRLGCRTSEYHIRARQHPDYHPLVVPVFHHHDNRSIGVGKAINGAGDIDTKESILRVQHVSTLGRPLSNGIHNNQQNVSSSQYTQQKHVAPPSAVAITSLSQTAASVGMTLEQLALALRSSNNLSKILISGPTVTEQRKQFALSLYQSENCSLYQRAMLLAGYAPDIAQNEKAPDHVQFMIAAWQLEGERLSTMMTENTSKPDGNRAATTTDQEYPRPTFNINGNDFDPHSHDNREHSNDQNENNCSDDHHHHSHNHDHESIKEQYEIKKNAVGDSSDRRGGRHIHRLEGKCGHQPVLHQPVGGKPHIDFVIGDRVECYHNVQPAQDLMWPSNYNCEDISCTDSCRDIIKTEPLSNVLPGSIQNELIASTLTTVPTGALGDPKVYERSELDFESDEWNFDFSASDSLLGLFKLGDLQQQQ